MPFPLKWGCLLVALTFPGALCAEDAVIYGSTPETAQTAATKPVVMINDKPVPVTLEATPDATPDQPHSSYPWKKKIVTTTFWVGQDANGYNDTTNYQSAWDSKWTQSFGGTDNPNERFGFLPKGHFAVTQNPFYFALPFNDVKYPDLARKWVPWYNKDLGKDQRYTSQCKGRWIEIRNQDGKSCFAQWQDVGPFRYDHASYVFGNDRPHTYNKAGLDVSPAVKTFLGLSGLDKCDWRFVEAWEVPEGPWITYGEQAIVLAAIKEREKETRHTSTVRHAARPTTVASE